MLQVGRIFHGEFQVAKATEVFVNGLGWRRFGKAETIDIIIVI